MAQIDLKNLFFFLAMMVGSIMFLHINQGTPSSCTMCSEMVHICSIFFFFFRERWTESTESFTFIFKKANVNKKRKKQKETCVECFVKRVPPLVEKGLN